MRAGDGQAGVQQCRPVSRASTLLGIVPVHQSFATGVEAAGLFLLDKPPHLIS